ncbi:CGNR zinc finger domain-containing protein [Mycobacterium sherrisii]|nr:CGNR zinc finger domain-containing protein [Mycobacterium sherrisii]
MVQDFLNTVAVPHYGSDLLEDLAPAQEWADRAGKIWSAQRGAPVEPPRLAEQDLPKLRALRGTVARLVRREEAAGAGPDSVAACFAVSGTGEVRLDPAGSGWRWLASAIWGEILLSQQADTWRRLKQCRNDPCETTFYDRSKNNSGVWCNAKTCGNVANLRASRARRRLRERAVDGGAVSSAPSTGAATPAQS